MIVHSDNGPNHTILINDMKGRQHVMAYSPADMREIYSDEQRAALADGYEVQMPARQTHVDLVAYYNRTQG